jgi:glycosyltransferase involved in cell wall biosynthesis
MIPYAIVAADFHKHGGMDRPNYELAWHLADRVGAPVHLVSYSVAEPLAGHPNVTWHRVPKPLRSNALAEYLHQRPMGRKIATQIAAQGGRVICNGGNTLWHDANWVHMVHAEWKGRCDEAPLAFRLRDSLIRSAHRRAERLSVTGARLVITNSNVARDQLVSLLGISPERVRVVYYGIDPHEFAPSSDEAKAAAKRSLGWNPDRPVAIFLGALGYDRRKGIDVVFGAWQELCKDPSWDVDFVAAGAGREVELWRSRASHAGLTDRFRLMGFTKEAAKLVVAADALISPTFSEAYGLGVHEAICSGLPAFVTRTAGVAERYPDDLSDLLLDAPPTPSDLARRLRKWRGAMPMFKQRVAGFSEVLRQRTWQDMAADIFALLEPQTKRAAVAEEVLA